MSLKGIEAGLHERRLLNDLFMYYDARLVKIKQSFYYLSFYYVNRERPVRNESYSVQLQFGVKYDNCQVQVPVLINPKSQRSPHAPKKG